MAVDDIQDFTIICQGGLDNKNTFIELSRKTPGAATKLINFEPGLYGGYRRINGFLPLDDTFTAIDPASAEGAVLGLIIYKDEIYGMRKQQATSTYKIYRYDSGSGWVAISPGFTLDYTSGTKTVVRIRHEIFNFGAGEILVFVDGVNPATMFDGTNWTQITSTNGGTTFADAGGPQALDAPSWVQSFEGHLFIGVDADYLGIVAHSAPRDATNWTSAAGAGQVVTGYNTNSFRPWRDKLFVFGRRNISYIAVEGSSFVHKNVVDTIGNIAPDTLVEVTGDLLFLSQDGFRPISGTQNIGDVELATLSRKVQRLVKDLSSTYTDDNITSVVIKQKSQVRFFFNSPAVSTPNTRGVIAGVREVDGQYTWEWGELLGIQATATCSAWFSDQEYILHGDYDGNVFRQEVGNSFNGGNITAVYSTPFIDFGYPMIRKTMRDVHLWIEPEGEVDIQASIKYDWKNPDILNPTAYNLEGSSVATSLYGSSTTLYGSSGFIYGGGIFPVLKEGIQGSCQSIQISFSTSGTEAPYAIQTIIYEFTTRARR